MTYIKKVEKKTCTDVFFDDDLSHIEAYFQEFDMVDVAYLDPDEWDDKREIEDLIGKEILYIDRGFVLPKSLQPELIKSLEADKKRRTESLKRWEVQRSNTLEGISYRIRKSIARAILPERIFI